MNEHSEKPAAILSTIRSHGHWQVQLRPSVFDEKRIESIAALERAVRKAHVELRGWDYPHISDRDGIARHNDFIQGTVTWETHHEFWRLYQSALFVHFFAMTEDWLQMYRGYSNVKPGEILEVTSTLWTLTEAFVFCGRLVEALQVKDDVLLSYKLVGIGGRQLQTLDSMRGPMMEWRKAAPNFNEYSEELTLPSQTLIGSAADLAVDQALHLYQRFHWEPDRASVVEEQRKLLERRL